MTQHKVIAEDSLSAMDEISKVLGKDAVILKTNKVNGKIEILGSNNIEDIASSNAKKIVKQKSSFSHLFYCCYNKRVVLLPEFLKTCTCCSPYFHYSCGDRNKKF